MDARGFWGAHERAAPENDVKAARAQPILCVSLPLVGTVCGTRDPSLHGGMGSRPFATRSGVTVRHSARELGFLLEKHLARLPRSRGCTVWYGMFRDPRCLSTVVPASAEGSRYDAGFTTMLVLCSKRNDEALLPESSALRERYISVPAPRIAAAFPLRFDPSPFPTPPPP